MRCERADRLLDRFTAGRIAKHADRGSGVTALDRRGAQALGRETRAGVRGEHRESFHNKFVLIDAHYAGSRRRLVFSGTHNFTRPALHTNDEVWMRTDDATTFSAFWNHWSVQRDQAYFTGSEDPIQVTALRYDAPGSDIAGRSGEFVHLTNVSNQPQALCGMRVRDLAGNQRIPYEPYCPVYGPWMWLAPSESVRIYTGCDDGSPSTDPITAWSWPVWEDFWCRSNVWNNTGDTFEVLRLSKGWLVERSLQYVP